MILDLKTTIWISLFSALLLVVALLELPVGYYTFLRIVISFTSCAIVYFEYQQKKFYWVYIFGLILILFNPIAPIYLGQKANWMFIDIAAALVFTIRIITSILTNKK